VTDELLTSVATDVRGRYYGKYRAVVTDDQDPETRGRLRLRIPSVLADTETSWAEPVIPFGGTADVGLFLIPPVQAIVWAEFEEGDLNRPLWAGTRWVAGTTSGDDAIGPPERHVVQTPGGHRVELDDTDGAPKLHVRHSGGAALDIDENGTVQIADQNGAALTLDAQQGQVLLEDANGNSITLSSQGISLEDANGNTISMASSGVSLKDAGGNSVELGPSGAKVNGNPVNISGASVMIG
jgi:hypothetical protein